MDKGARDKEKHAWGCPPPLVMGIRDQLRRGLAVARLILLRAKAEGPTRSENCGLSAPLRKTLVLCLLCVALFVVPALAQQQPPPTPPDGFVPASSLPNQEQLPAAPLVITAYSIVWLLVLGYVWSVWSRIARAERELADVSRRIGAGQRQ